MPKSLKRVAEPDTFDFGKAVTLILSEVKELSKTRNGLVDDVNYLESRKKQEGDTLERILVEKTEAVKARAEVIQKIGEKKSEFLSDVSVKREELASKEVDLTRRETEFANANIKAGQILVQQRDELELRSNDLKKDVETRSAHLDQREKSLNDIEAKQKEENKALAIKKDELDRREVEIASQHGAYDNKLIDLDNREELIIKKEQELEKQRVNLATMAGDLENQASLVQSERNKNKSDAEYVSNMHKQIKDKQLELTAREIHLKDREATVLSR